MDQWRAGRGEAGGHAPSVKIFRGCEKLEKGAKTALLMMQKCCLSGKIQNLEKLKNSSTFLGVFASEKGRVAKVAKAL